MRILTTILAVSTLFLVSCNRYKKSKSGMPYKISGSTSQKFKVGQFVKAHFLFKVKDSTLNSTYDHIPAYFKVDSSMVSKYNFTEVMFECGPGNTLEFKLSIDSLKKLGQLDYSQIFKKGDFIIGKVDFVKTFASAEEQQADANKEIENEKQREIKAVKDYAAKEKLATKSTPGGVEVYVEKEGDGMKADSGTRAFVYYTGKLLSNGKVFDSNVKNGVKGEPISFNVGTHAMIPGWDEGIKFFKKGGKGKFIIPAMMAYGMQGAPGGVIPPFANLVFDIEVSDVTIATPEKREELTPEQKAAAQDPHQGH